MKVSKKFLFQCAANVAAGVANFVAAAAVASLLLFFVASPAPSSVRIVEGFLAFMGCAMAYFVVEFFSITGKVFQRAVAEGVEDELAANLVEEHFWTTSVWYGVFAAISAVSFFLAAHGSLSNSYSHVSVGMVGFVSGVIAMAIYARARQLARKADEAELAAEEAAALETERRE